MNMAKDAAIKGAITGAIAAGGSMAIFGESLNNSQQVLGFNLPVPIAVGAGAAVGSVAADVAHQYILPHIPGNKKFATLESAGLGIVVSGGATMWAIDSMGGVSERGTDAFLLGAGSYVLGDWAADKIYPMMGSAVNLF